jgi:hypothetical protein
VLLDESVASDTLDDTGVPRPPATTKPGGKSPVNLKPTAELDREALKTPE